MRCDSSQAAASSSSAAGGFLIPGGGEASASYSASAVGGAAAMTTTTTTTTSGAGTRAGVGLVLEREQTGSTAQIFVRKLVPGSPAFTNGSIQVNDKLISIDGTPMGNLHLDKVFEMINGPPGRCCTCLVSCGVVCRLCLRACVLVFVCGARGRHKCWGSLRHHTALSVSNPSGGGGLQPLRGGMKVADHLSLVRARACALSLCRWLARSSLSMTLERSGTTYDVTLTRGQARCILCVRDKIRLD